MSKSDKQMEISDNFKLFQNNINKVGNFKEGIKHLLNLRALLMDLGDDNSFEGSLWYRVDRDDFFKMPLKKDKTVAYYLYHLTRIEDITSNLLIAHKNQIFYSENFNIRLAAPITTTGNELIGEEITEFSKCLNIEALKEYRKQVYLNTNRIIDGLNPEQSKTKVVREDIDKIMEQKSVSTHSDAVWLLDYWGSKNYTGLLLMPFSRHQMLHLDGCFRILNKLGK